MYKFLQRNQKKMLAVFGVFLMIVFILPSTFNAGQGARENPVVAYVGDEKVRAEEFAQARADWDVLRRITVPYGYQQFPYVQIKLGRLASAIETSPELFLLLQKEAQRQGIRVSPDRADALVQTDFNLPQGVQAGDKDRLRHAAESFLAVQALYDRTLDNVKVSEPRVERQLALDEQEVRLNLVEFSADDYLPATTAPTTQEVQDHFRRYAGVAPGQSPATATAGTLPFGYQYPDRVKIQYLAVTRDQVRQAVKKSRSDYEWEVAAQRYYQTHPREFPVTQPSALPLGPASPLAMPPPTTKPFGEVRDEVMERVMQPETERLLADVRSAVARRLRNDWEQYRAAGGKPAAGPATAVATSAATTSAAATARASATATAPSTQPGGYASFAYLEGVAADIQKQFGVLPAVTSKSDQWLTIEDLSKLPGIGFATRRTDRIPLANYVLQSAEAFMPVPEKADPASVLSVLEPSEPLEDFTGDVYFFRLTDAQRARAPSDLAEVKDKVESDLRAGRGYAKAMDEAKKFLESAKQGRLPAAAAAAGRNVVPTGFFASGGGMRFGPTTIPNYPTGDASRAALVKQAFDQLLARATPQDPHPVALIELPSERKVLVAELGDVKSNLRPDDTFVERLRMARQMTLVEGQDLVGEWFRPDAVKARLGYRPADPEAEAEADDADPSEQASAR